MPDHRVLVEVFEHTLENRKRIRIIHLTQHIRKFVFQEQIITLKTWIPGQTSTRRRNQSSDGHTFSNNIDSLLVLESLESK